jgi:hypothetical protein
MGFLALELALAISLALAFLVGKRLTRETQQLASRASAVGALGPALPYQTQSQFHEHQRQPLLLHELTPLLKK